MSVHNQDMREYISRINTRFNNNNNDETFNEIVMDIDLDDNNKKIFIRRISEILINSKKKCKIYNIVLTTLRYILQIFSAVLTFTLSINSLTTIPYLNYINLAILFILTLTTNIYFQSKLGEKYITVKKSYNKVLKELWAYISLSGSYSGKSQQENLTLFYNTIDKIVEQENNAVINIDREIDRTMSSGGNGNNNIPKMKLGSKNDDSKIDNKNKDIRQEPEPGSGAGVKAEPGPGAGVKPEPGPGAGVKPEPGPGAGVKAEPGSGAGVKPGSEAGVKAEPGSGAGIVDKNYTIIDIPITNTNNENDTSTLSGMIL
jgi:hypothetical protein